MKPKFNLLNVSILLILLSVTAQVAGQHHPMKPQKEEKMEQIKAHKVAFITDRLALTPEEAQRFWPVYNEFEDKREAELRNFRDNFIDKYPDLMVISDKDAEVLVDAHMDHRERMLVLEKQYNQKFREVLPIKKVLLLLESEKEFKKVLMDKIRKH